MKNQRPVNLSLITIRFPLTAIVSILHRLSGLLLFLLLIPFLYAVGLSLTSPSGFSRVHDFMVSSCGKMIVFSFFAPFLYHFLAGIKHLLMDCGWGETKRSGRLASQTLLFIFLVLIILMGRWLWQ